MGKTKAEIETENAELRERLETDASPARSEVLPGGGTSIGAVLHLRVPIDNAPGADHPTVAPVPPALLEFVSKAAEGADVTFPEHYSLPLADGGYANAGRIRVVHQPEAGRTVVEVVA